MPDSVSTWSLLRHHAVARALRAAAAEVPVHLVGGIVRDRMLGLPAADFDATVARDGKQIAERLAAALPARLVLLGGEAFAAYRLVGRSNTLDLWDREGATLHHDLARRDFTVNAMALDLADGTLHDPFDGQRDLHDRVLRAVTPASFTGDPLRVLRLVRLAAQLPGFAADHATVALAQRSAPSLERIAAERVREELGMLFGLPAAHHGLALLGALDLYPGLWLGRPGEPTAGRYATAVHELECLAGAALVLRRHALGWADELDWRAARWAVTFAHLPGVDPRAALRGFGAAGYLTRSAEERVATLLAIAELPRGEPACRLFLHRTGDLWPTAAALLGARAERQGDAGAWERWLRSVVELLEHAGDEILRPAALLSGNQVQALLGVAPGPAVGRALARVRVAQVLGKVRTTDQAKELLLATYSAASG